MNTHTLISHYPHLNSCCRITALSKFVLSVNIYLNQYVLSTKFRNLISQSCVVSLMHIHMWCDTINSMLPDNNSNQISLIFPRESIGVRQMIKLSIYQSHDYQPAKIKIIINNRLIILCLNSNPI